MDVFSRCKRIAYFDEFENGLFDKKSPFLFLTNGI